MGVTDRPQYYIDRIRGTEVLSRETVRMMHHSLVLDCLRQSIEDAKIQIDHSWVAVHESRRLLRRLRTDGF